MLRQSAIPTCNLPSWSAGPVASGRGGCSVECYLQRYRTPYSAFCAVCAVVCSAHARLSFFLHARFDAAARDTGGTPRPIASHKSTRNPRLASAQTQACVRHGENRDLLFPRRQPFHAWFHPLPPHNRRFVNGWSQACPWRRHRSRRVLFKHSHNHGNMSPRA